MSCAVQSDYPSSLVFRINDNGVGPDLLRQVFLERGWSEFDEDTQLQYDWNLWWRTSRFRTSDYDLIYPWQRLNHHPKSTMITKKDTLARNLKRMRCVHGANVFNFSPLSFNLPNDYTKYVKAYGALRQKAEGKPTYWICKPADMSRGRGIFIFRDLSELLYDCNAVVQHYIDNPLLIGGYKFDLRIYVVVTSFQPLRLYIHEEGIVRFSTEKFDLNSTKNVFAHLTNTSINKHSPGYTEDKERVGPGCKWTLTQLRHYFLSNNIHDHMLWRRIVNIVILTMLVQAPQVQKMDNCFELYGFDILIDENLKPWLLEVNFSPALGTDCQADILAKKPMLHDLMDLMHFHSSDAERGGEHFRRYYENFSQQNSSQRRGSLSLKGAGGNRRDAGRLGSHHHRQNRTPSARTDTALLGGSRENISFGLPLVRKHSASRDSCAERRDKKADFENCQDRKSNLFVDGRLDQQRDMLSGESSNRYLEGMLDRVVEPSLMDRQGSFPLSHLSKQHSKTTQSADSHDSGCSGESKGSKASADSGIGGSTNSVNLSTKSPRVSVYGCLPEVASHPWSGSGMMRRDSGCGGEDTLYLPSLQSSASSMASKNTVLTPRKITYSISDQSPLDTTSPQQQHLSRSQHAMSTKSLPAASNGRNRKLQEDSGPITNRSCASMSTTSSLVTGPRHTSLRQQHQSTISHYPSAPARSRFMQPHPRQQKFPLQNKTSQHGGAFKNLQRRAGGFHLVFPFNEATHKVGSTLDAKVVIRETQNLVKAALNTVSNSRSSPENHATDSGVKRDCEDLWAPIRGAKENM